MAADYRSAGYPYLSTDQASAFGFSTYEEAESFVKKNPNLIESFVKKNPKLNDKIHICEVKLQSVGIVKITKGEVKIDEKTLKNLEYYSD